MLAAGAGPPSSAHPTLERGGMSRLERRLRLASNGSARSACGVWCSHRGRSEVTRLLPKVRPEILWRLCSGSYWLILNMDKLQHPLRHCKSAPVFVEKEASGPARRSSESARVISTTGIIGARTSVAGACRCTRTLTSSIKLAQQGACRLGEFAICIVSVLVHTGAIRAIGRVHRS